MQQIERYGVIALVFLLVTIVAVSFWGDSKSPGFWSRLTGKHDAKKEQADKLAAAEELAKQNVIDPNLPMTDPAAPVPPIGGSMPIDGNVLTSADQPPAPIDTGIFTGAQPNPFGPEGAQPLPPSTLPPSTLPPIQPAPPAMVSYVVQKGDSLASIARKRLGAESRWTEIQAANAGLEPKNLRVGNTILLPADAKTVVAADTRKFAPTPAKPRISDPKNTETKKAETKKSPAVASKSGGTYKIKKGDGLRSIARKELGDESRWKEIQSLNPDIQANRLMVGDTIKLPVSRERASGSGPVLASAPVGSKASPASNDKPRVR
jgi:nucleoid-associated protein YgaU